MRKETAWAACPPRARRLGVRAAAVCAMQSGAVLRGGFAFAMQPTCLSCNNAGEAEIAMQKAVAR